MEPCQQPQQPLAELVVHHPGLPGDPTAYYAAPQAAAAYQTIQPLQPALPLGPQQQPAVSCVQIAYGVAAQPAEPISMHVGHLQSVQHHQQQHHQLHQQQQQQPIKQCRCKCTCDASAPTMAVQPAAPAAAFATAPAPAVPTAAAAPAAGPSKPARPKPAKSAKRSPSSAAAPESPIKCGVARVEGPARPPVPLVEELHRFSCRICGKTFKLKGAVVVHMRVHSLERKHSCNYCDMKFKGESSPSCAAV